MDRELEVLEVLRWLADQVDLQRNDDGTWTAWACEGTTDGWPKQLDPPPPDEAHVLDMVRDDAQPSEQPHLISTVVRGSCGDLNSYGSGRCGHLAPYPGCAKCSR